MRVCATQEAGTAGHRTINAVAGQSTEQDAPGEKWVPGAATSDGRLYTRTEQAVYYFGAR